MTTETTTTTTTPTDRDRATAWARRVLADSQARILALDTTDIHSSAEPVAIAVTTTAGVVRVNALVLPEGEVDEEAAGLHGLTRRVLDRAGAPTFPEVYERLAAALAGRTIATYNVGYVGRILDHACLPHGLDFIPHSYADDAMEHYAAYRGKRAATGRYLLPRLPRSQGFGWRGPVRTCRDIALLLRVMAAAQEV